MTETKYYIEEDRTDGFIAVCVSKILRDEVLFLVRNKESAIVIVMDLNNAGRDKVDDVIASYRASLLKIELSEISYAD